METKSETRVTQAATGNRVRTYVVSGLAVVILLVSLFGFGSKFLEFIELVRRRDVDGAFAVTPVVNYLLASLGFLCLFCWAVVGGMFHDIERPKQTMLDNEQKLDGSRDVRAYPPLF